MLFLVLVTSLIYFQSFFHELIFLDDDIIVYERFEENNVVSNIKTAFTTNYLGGHYYRPVTLLSFILNSEVGGKSPSIYHISNYLIFLLTSLLLFLVLKSSGYSLIISFTASLFFALNPIHINAVGWIAGRGDLLAGFFSISALFFVIKFINLKDLTLLLAISISLLLAILSKEASLPVPLLLTAFIFIEKKDLNLSKTNTFPILMILFVIGSYYLLRVLISDVHINKFSFTTFYSNIFVLLETISKFFLPPSIKALPRFEPLTSLSGGVIVSILLILPIKIKNINKYRYYFGLIWFVTLMLPGMVFQTMGQDGFFYWDCRSYLPSIGLILMLAEVAKTIGLNSYRKIIYALVTIYLVVISIYTFFLIGLYKNAPSYWSSVKADYPESYLPYVGIYNYYNHLENFYEAENQLLVAIKIRPNESSIRQMLIKFYSRNDESIKAFNVIKDGIFEHSLHSDYYLNNFISLSVESNQLLEIDTLRKHFSQNEVKISKINQMIDSKIQELEASGDTLKAQKLSEIINDSTKYLN